MGGHGQPTTCPACNRPLECLQLNFAEWMLVCKGSSCLFPFDAESPDLYILDADPRNPSARRARPSRAMAVGSAAGSAAGSGTSLGESVERQSKRQRLSDRGADRAQDGAPVDGGGSGLSPDLVPKGVARDFTEQQLAVLKSLPPPVGSLQQVFYSGCGLADGSERHGLLDGTRDLNRDDIADLLGDDGRLDSGVLSNLVVLLHQRQFAGGQGMMSHQHLAGTSWLISPVASTAICDHMNGDGGAAPEVPLAVPIAEYRKIIALLAIPWLGGDEPPVPQSSPAISPPYSPAGGGGVPAKAGPQEYACVEICIPRDTDKLGCVRLHCALRYKYSRRDLDADTNEASLLSATKGVTDWAAAWADGCGQQRLAASIRRTGSASAVQIVPFGTCAGHPINGLLAFKTAELATQTKDGLAAPKFVPADFAPLRKEVTLCLWQQELVRTGLADRIQLAALPALHAEPAGSLARERSDGSRDDSHAETAFDDGGTMMLESFEEFVASNYRGGGNGGQSSGSDLDPYDALGTTADDQQGLDLNLGLFDGL